MMRSVLIASALLAAGLAAGPAAARSGGSSYGDSYWNDMQRNPRLVEPGGDAGRYLSYYGRQGYYQRRVAQPYGVGGYRGQVYVRPYGY